MICLFDVVVACSKLNDNSRLSAYAIMGSVAKVFVVAEMFFAELLWWIKMLDCVRKVYQQCAY